MNKGEREREHDFLITGSCIFRLFIGGRVIRSTESSRFLFGMGEEKVVSHVSYSNSDRGTDLRYD
jgi:hypothetical protein